MSIILEGNKKIIIDRTLPEIVRSIKNIDKSSAIIFLELLKELGIDFIEVDKLTVDTLETLPKLLDYIFRIKDFEDIEFINKYNFKFVVMDYKDALSFSFNHVEGLNEINMILNISIEELDNFIESDYNKLFSVYNISCVRISGVDKYNLSTWKDLIYNIQNRFKVKIDFCADNKYYMATAISLEACMDGADSITAVFNGEKYGFTPLEEIIMALKVIKNSEICGDLKLMSKLSDVYKNLTKENICSMKAILGEDIFKYESGIHVDGIEKNPTTYEPFDPNDIGQKRKMLIGKHSGSKAVIIKLKELDVSCKNIDIDIFLKKIRETSIQLKRNIEDHELIEMYNSLSKCS